MMNNLFDVNCTLHGKLSLIKTMDHRRRMLDGSNRINLKIGTNGGSAYIFCGTDIDEAFDKMGTFLCRNVVDVYKYIDFVDPYHIGINILIEGNEHGRHWFEGDDKYKQQSGDATGYGSISEEKYLVSCAIRDANLPNEFTMKWATNTNNEKQALDKQETDLKRALETAYELGYDFSCVKGKILNAKGPDDISYIMHTLAVDDYI